MQRREASLPLRWQRVSKRQRFSQVTLVSKSLAKTSIFLRTAGYSSIRFATYVAAEESCARKTSQQQVTRFRFGAPSFVGRTATTVFRVPSKTSLLPTRAFARPASTMTSAGSPAVFRLATSMALSTNRPFFDFWRRPSLASNGSRLHQRRRTTGTMICSAPSRGRPIDFERCFVKTHHCFSKNFGCAAKKEKGEKIGSLPARKFSGLTISRVLQFPHVSRGIFDLRACIGNFRYNPLSRTRRMPWVATPAT